MSKKEQTTSKANYLLRRFGAGFIDVMLIMMYVILLYLLSTFLNDIFPFHDRVGESYILRHLMSLSTLTIPTILYFVISESKYGGATIGKKWLSLKVKSVVQDHPDVTKLWIRNGIKFLPWEIVHTTLNLYPEFLVSGEITSSGIYLGYGLCYLLMIIYISMLLFRNDHRSIYEIVSDTCVVDNS
jgi:uncharacterized RDD family membrane protein YckC